MYITTTGEEVRWEDAGYVLAAGEVDCGLEYPTEAKLSALIPAYSKFPALILASVAKTYSDVDALYATTVGNRGEEYRQAEAAATAFQASGTPSEYVSAWAAANPPMTDAESAAAILARAAALRAAILSVRTQRFASQAAMRAATTQAELDAAIAVWAAFVATTKAAIL